MADLDYRPRRCFYAPAQGPNATIRLRFDSIAFGKVLHGHHGLYVEAERDQKGAPVEIAFRSGDKSFGKLVHRDGEGWKGFELDTSDGHDIRGWRVLSEAGTELGADGCASFGEDEKPLEAVASYGRRGSWRRARGSLHCRLGL